MTDISELPKKSNPEEEGYKQDKAGNIYSVKAVAERLCEELPKPIKELQGDIPEEPFKEILEYMLKNKMCHVDNGTVIKDAPSERTERKGLEVYDGETFIKMDIPKPDFQIEGLMIEKGITILGGFQSTFKTHTAAHLALSIINGANFLGKFPCKKGGVLYVNEELHSGAFQKLIIEMAHGCDLKITKDLIIMNFQNLKIDRPEDNKKYIEIIEKHKIKLVIFDAFRECFIAAENSGDEITKVLTEFVRPIIEKTGCSFLVIMHKGKASAASDARQAVDLLRGSSVFRNYPDSIILMDRMRMTERVEMTHEKIRGAKEQEPLSIIWKFGNGSIRPEVLSEAELEKVLIDDCKRDILEFVKDLDELETGKETKVYKKLIASQKYSNGTFYDAIKELCEEGKLHKDKKGLYEVIDRRLNEF